MARSLIVGTLLLASACAGGSDDPVQTAQRESEVAAPVPDERAALTPASAARTEEARTEEARTEEARTEETRIEATQARRSRRRPSIEDEALEPNLIDGDAEVDTQFGVASVSGGASGLRYRARLVTGLPYAFPTYEFVVNNTGSGLQEKFLFQVPLDPPPPGTKVPLLVVFHKYGASHGDVIHTQFPEEAVGVRGWYLLAPLGSRQKHFGSIEAQINTRAAIDLVLRLFSAIDHDRIYGVGFSMGAGALANFAARHTDTSGPMFAAIVNHTGTVSLGHTHYWEVDDFDFDDNIPTYGDNLEPAEMMDFLFGGPPWLYPFTYQRFSTIDMEPLSGAIDPNADMSRNLAHVPIWVWMANQDPNVYLREETTAFDTHVRLQNPANDLRVVISNEHRWATLDYAEVCAWLAQRTLTIPTSGDVLADEDGRFFHFGVEQEIPGQFTPFTWTWNAAAQALSVSDTANLHVLSMDLVEMGASALTGNFLFDLSTNDGTGDKIKLTNVGIAPLAVTRDGVAATATYDAVAHTLAFTEPESGSHVWIVTFP